MVEREADVATRDGLVGRQFCQEFELGPCHRVEVVVRDVREGGDVGDHSHAVVDEADEFGQREGGMFRTSTPEHGDLLNRRRLQRGKRTRRDRCVGQAPCTSDEDARDVERDVAISDHDRTGVRQVGIERGEVGMAVVPTDERRGRSDAGSVDVLDLEATIRRRTSRPDHRVMPCAQVVERDVTADLGVEKDLDSWIAGDVVEQVDDLSGSCVIRGDAVAREAEGASEAFVDNHRHRAVAEQVVGRIHRRRPRSDDAH